VFFSFCVYYFQFVNMGIKFVSRSPSPLVPDCDYRITQEVGSSHFLVLGGYYMLQGYHMLGSPRGHILMTKLYSTLKDKTCDGLGLIYKFCS
jgi:hypothetical protein